MVAEVRIDGSHADVSFTVHPHVRSVFFAWEAGAWGISLWKTLALAERDLKQAFEQSGEADEIAWSVADLGATSPKTFDVALIERPPR